MDKNPQISHQNAAQTPIVAGIINLRTGEISDTTTRHQEKTKLYLKVRDELNAKAGSIAFLTFDFGSLGGTGNLAYIASQMGPSAKMFMKDVRMLKAEYNTFHAERAVEAAEASVEALRTVMAECLAQYCETTNGQKRRIVQDAFDDALSAEEEQLDGLRSHLNQRRRARQEAIAAAAVADIATA